MLSKLLTFASVASYSLAQTVPEECGPDDAARLTFTEYVIYTNLILDK